MPLYSSTLVEDLQELHPHWSKAGDIKSVGERMEAEDPHGVDLRSKAAKTKGDKGRSKIEILDE